MEIICSIVMQVNLEGYNNSRSNAISKFKRVIKSFQEQIYKNCELIIVADGCKITEKIYDEFYKKEKNIKFVYFDRVGFPKMYDIVETPKGNATYFRGMARQLGCAAASGEIITYIDSDDYLVKEFTQTCYNIYKKYSDKSWWLNTSWFDHELVENSKQNIGVIKNPKEIENVQLNVLTEHKFKPMEVKDGKAVMAPWLLIHKNNLSIKWRDTNSTIGSEDADFYNRMVKKYPKGHYFKEPIYIRCHYKDVWDI